MPSEATEPLFVRVARAQGCAVVETIDGWRCECEPGHDYLGWNWPVLLRQLVELGWKVEIFEWDWSRTISKKGVDCRLSHDKRADIRGTGDDISEAVAEAWLTATRASAARGDAP